MSKGFRFGKMGLMCFYVLAHFNFWQNQNANLQTAN